MSELIGWVKSIACFYIIASLIMHIIPGKGYLQYIKVFLGIVAIILLLKPVGKIFSMENKFNTSLNNNLHIQMEDSLKRDLQLVGEYRKEAVIGTYTDVIDDNIKKYVEELGIIYEDSNVLIDLDEESATYGGIKSIEVYIDIPFDEKENNVSKKGFYEIEIKNYLANFYNLKERNININISEENEGWELKYPRK
jgi:hypothetical protein